MTLKSHHNYQAQISLIAKRKLSYNSPDTLLQALRAVGYYRLSAYTYPFRKAVLNEEGLIISRLDDFEPGATFEYVMQIYEFDRRLRLLIQDALEEIEVAFCAQIGYVLGRRSPDAHLNSEELDEAMCSALNRRGKPNHKVWLERYSQLRHNARNEDYVKHHQDSYADRMPIWVATEFIDFGSIIRLFEMMKKEDRIEIAASFGLKNDQAGVMDSWMLALNDLRNRCAHNNRVWNRFTRAPRKPSTQMTSKEFHHFNNLEEIQQVKLYGVVAVIAYLIRNINKGTTWPMRAKREFESFGNIFGLTLENTMGFPEKWQNEKLWNFTC